MKKLVVSMFFMVATSFFIVCGASATSFDGYYQYGTVTSIVTDQVLYNDLSIPAGTESYFDVSFTFGQVTYYNSTMQQISVGSVTYSTNIGFLSISCSDPSVVISYDEDNRVHCLFQNDYSGDLQFSIKYYIRNTLTGGSPSNATLQNITMRRSVTTHYGNMNHSFNGAPSLGVIDDKLDQILDSLGESSYLDFLGDDALFYVRSDYFSNSFGCSFNSDGWIDVSSWSDFGVYNWSKSNMPGYQFSPGTYLVYVMRSGGVQPDSIVFEGVDNSFYSFERLYVSSQLNPAYYFDVFLLDIKQIFSYTTLHFHYTGSATDSLPVYIGFAVASDDFIAGEAINPDQSGLVEDVNNAGQQQQQQEDQLWNNINSYKGELTFNLDDWSEAAGGLSYVSGIFMQIWNNSPTQVIVLSLMLGIAMLSIGRGAMAAVRVSRNRRNDD